ncbi:MAG TPA: hypothetical protein VNT75_23780, partial [Symbiobacteriaceae bacterium]|nr:hypothetical protein [Symbiobacteriaceae bacterium]
AAPIKAQLAPLEEQLQAAKAAGDKVQAVVIRARIAELKLKLAVEIAALQPLRDQVKALQAVAKASRESLKTALAPLQPLVDQEKALAAANQNLRNQAKTAREAAQAAMKAGNWSTMLSEFDRVISLQQQALTNLQQIGGLKTQIGAGLQAAIDAHK